MAGYSKHTVEEVREALQRSNGIFASAAKVLGVHRHTISNYVKKWPELENTRAECTESLIDFAESKLIEAVRDGKAWAIRFVLATKGASRGWRMTKTVEGSITIKTVTMEDISDDELLEAIRGSEPELVLLEAAKDE